MVNSGSILTNALLQTLMQPEMSLAEKFDYVNDYVKVNQLSQFIFLHSEMNARQEFRCFDLFLCEQSK